MLSSLLALVGCGPIDTDTAADRLERDLQRAVEGDDSLRHGVLRVEDPTTGLSGTWAAGDASVDTPFLGASVGKLFTAVTVVALAEEGVVSLDDPFVDWVDEAVWSDLPVVGGNEAVRRITLRQLLGHRSGLPDYFQPEVAAEDGAESVATLLTTEPDRGWTPVDLLDYTRAHFAPAGAPGERFVYADTNYDLLGLAIEGAAGRPFHEVVRSTVIEPLGLGSTWYHAREARPEGVPPLADVWSGDVNLGGTAALSVDWAGGGIATTAPDLARFVAAVRDEELVALASLRDPLTEDALNRGIDYGQGLWRIRPGRLFFALGGLPTMQGASGSTGAFAYWLEGQQAVVVGTFDQLEWQEEHVRYLLSKVVPTVLRVEAP